MEINPQSAQGSHYFTAADFQHNEKDPNDFKKQLAFAQPNQKVNPNTGHDALFKNLLQHLQIAHKNTQINENSHSLKQLLSTLEHCIFQLAAHLNRHLLYHKKRKALPLQQRFAWLYDEVTLLANHFDPQLLSQSESQQILNEIKTLSLKLEQYF